MDVVHTALLLIVLLQRAVTVKFSARRHYVTTLMKERTAIDFRATGSKSKCTQTSWCCHQFASVMWLHTVFPGLHRQCCWSSGQANCSCWSKQLRFIDKSEQESKSLLQLSDNVRVTSKSLLLSDSERKIASCHGCSSSLLHKSTATTNKKIKPNTFEKKAWSRLILVALTLA